MDKIPELSDPSTIPHRNHSEGPSSTQVSVKVKLDKSK